MAQNPYLDPNAQEILGLQRQQKLADLLSQRGMEMPEQQMVSGRVVPINPLQSLVPMLNAYQGRKMSENVEQKSKALADLLRSQQQQELKDFMQEATPRSAVEGGIYDQTGARTMATTPDMYNADMSLAKGYQNRQAQPAYQPNQMGMATKALGSMNPMLQSIGSKILEKQLNPESFNLVQNQKRFQMVNGKPTLIAEGNLKPEPKPASYQEYLLAKEEGFKGTYNDYQTLDANRKAPRINVNTGDNLSEGGGYNKKGDYIAPGGVFIGKAEVAKDRELVKTATEVVQGLNEIKAEDVKKSASILGNVTEGGIKGYLAKQTGNEAVAAQTKINASAVMQLLQNLPPGPASDKDISMARSTFPGYGNEKDLNDWIVNTKATLQRKIDNTNNKYGTDTWYGAKTLSSSSVSKEDQDAMNWAKSNPNDPRSAQILEKLKRNK